MPPCRQRMQSAQALARAEVNYYAEQLPNGTVVNCTAPAGNPAFGTLAWHICDVENRGLRHRPAAGRADQSGLQLDPDAADARPLHGAAAGPVGPSRTP